MRTILSLAVGFWLGRQIYIQYDKEEALKKEKVIKARLKKFLEENGLTKSEAKEQTSDLLGV
ncbi:hypothetical protein QQ008_07700 [Fulvivirgaceae bacterium BMA10]|uniref:YtxH domain-containing protein n=1 Tax=Splendidivirga corallicola TaxID=3051826 RepID=A0ABT8KNW6_9BACT|nr:hypothetical protein [Fulvivirgaceae bacterium BMA10]